MTPIPRSLDDLTPTWLTSAFRDAGVLLGGRGRVVEATAVRIGQEYGFTGVVGRLDVRYEDASGDLPGSLVAKLPAFQEARIVSDKLAAAML